MKKIRLIAWAVLPALLLSLTLIVAQEAKKKRTPSPKGAMVYVVSPKEGETVKRKFKVIFGLNGMGICPAGITAGDGSPLPNTGHHHLLVDVANLTPAGDPLPADQPTKILHYGAGQTEAMLDLTPGKHTLQLVFADYAHVAHDPPVISEKVSITVSE